MILTGLISLLYSAALRGTTVVTELIPSCASCPSLEASERTIADFVPSSQSSRYRSDPLLLLLHLLSSPTIDWLLDRPEASHVHVSPSRPHPHPHLAMRTTYHILVFFLQRISP